MQLGSNATDLLKNATMFAKGCCIHGGMVFSMQSHFSCRDVESIPFQAMNAALFGKAFALVCLLFLFSVHVCFG